MEVFYTARFLRTFAKLEQSLQDDVESTINDFAHNPHTPHLKLHKLHGNMKQYHAFSANYNYRVVVKIEKGKAQCMDVGGHNIYQ